MSNNEKDQQKPGRRTDFPRQGARDESGITPDGPLSDEAAEAAAPEGAAMAGNGAHGAASRPKNDGAGSDEGVDERPMQYMITPRRGSFAPMGLAGLSAAFAPDMEGIYNSLKTMSDVTVVRRVRPEMSLMSVGLGRPQDIIVARVKASDRHLLARFANPSLIVERDYLLGHLADSRPSPIIPKIGVRPLSVGTTSLSLQFHVQDSAGNPQANCAIVLYTNAGREDQGTTDAQGNTAVEVSSSYLNDVAALYVKPHADCWERFTYRPDLTTAGVNQVVLQRLSDFSAADFTDPGTAAISFSGWGQRLMGLPQMAGRQMGGKGVKVAIVDSGCDVTHPALTQVRIGQDYTNLNANHVPDAQSWRTDGMGHGTHCAGVIAGNGNQGHIRGFVPDAEIHVLKLFPGGAFNNLAAALNYCIDNKIDVVNCSLGGDQESEAIAQLIETARQAGVALVVAAGNSGGPVQFPARVAGVMCVSAIGELGEFPDNTYHARTCSPGTANADGLFPANFSCSGPRIDLCAPGVAVISSVPGGGYAAWDGTSMAAPAVTGLLAMVLAHHPEFAGKPVVRDASRIDRLFQLVASAAEPLGMPQERTGAGLPRLIGGGPNGGGPLPRMAEQGAAAMGAGAVQMDQAQLQEIIRNALISSLGALNNASGARVF